jgi:hypothetical protein
MLPRFQRDVQVGPFQRLVRQCSRRVRPVHFLALLGLSLLSFLLIPLLFTPAPPSTTTAAATPSLPVNLSTSSPTTTPPLLPPLPIPHTTPAPFDAVLAKKAVVAEFAHAWEGYATFAWGSDELLPLTNGTNDSWGAMAVTMVDAMDSLYLLGFRVFIFYPPPPSRDRMSLTARLSLLED